MNSDLPIRRVLASWAISRSIASGILIEMVVTETKYYLLQQLAIPNSAIQVKAPTLVQNSAPQGQLGIVRRFYAGNKSGTA